MAELLAGALASLQALLLPIVVAIVLVGSCTDGCGMFPQETAAMMGDAER